MVPHLVSPSVRHSVNPSVSQRPQCTLYAAAAMTTTSKAKAKATATEAAETEANSAKKFIEPGPVRIRLS